MANWEATIAAVRARGPRCEDCGRWTFRPQYLDESVPKIFKRLCPRCLPINGFPSWLTGLAITYGPKRS